MAEIKGYTGTVAEVDSNRFLKVALTGTETDAGYVRAMCENDAGDVTGTASVVSPEVTDDYRLRVGVDQLLMSEWFNAAAVNSAIWTTPVTTMTIATSGGYLVLNSGSSLASGAVARTQSYRTFTVQGASGLSMRMRAQFPFTPVASNVCEWGLFFSSGTTAPTDGVLFRLNASSEFRCVVVKNSTESQSAVLNFSTLVGTNTTKDFSIDIHEDGVNFWINDVLVYAANFDTGVGPMTAGALPVGVRIYNSGATASAQQIKVSYVAVVQADVHTILAPAAAAAGAGWTCHQGQTGHTMGTTASYANSADPTAAAALSNTAALVTGLGGQARFNAAATAVTDGIVTSYQNPAASLTVQGKTLYITGVKISSANLGAAVATTATTLAWSLAFGHTSVSLATAEATASGTKAPRRVALGLQTWPVGAAIGQMPQNGDLFMPFASPIAVYPGEFVASVAKFIVGTATASQVIWCHVTFDGFFA